MRMRRNERGGSPGLVVRVLDEPELLLVERASPLVGSMRGRAEEAREVAESPNVGVLIERAEDSLNNVRHGCEVAASPAPQRLVYVPAEW
jgi:hypothetical protein